MAQTDYYFQVIAESKSLTKAAEKLYVSQPSLTKYVQRLEKRMGIELFDHNSSPLRLTNAGELYYAHLKQVQSMEQKLKEDFDQIRMEGRDRIRIGIPPWRGTVILPHVLPYYLESNPMVSVDVIENNGEELERALQNDEIDFCIQHYPLKASNVHFEVLVNEKILLIGNNDLSAVQQANRRPCTPGHFRSFDIQSIGDTPVVFPAKGQKRRRLIDSLLAKEGLHLNNWLETENTLTSYYLTALHKCYAFVSELAIMDFPQQYARNVSYFEIGDPRLSFQLVVMYKSDTQLSIASRKFIDLLKDFYKEHLSEV